MGFQETCVGNQLNGIYDLFGFVIPLFIFFSLICKGKGREGSTGGRNVVL